MCLLDKLHETPDSNTQVLLLREIYVNLEQLSEEDRKSLKKFLYLPTTPLAYIRRKLGKKAYSEICEVV